MENPLNIYWVRKDLRLTDNQVLQILSLESTQTLFIWCPSASDGRAERFRQSFLRECLFKFSSDLTQFSQKLFVSPFGIRETLDRLTSVAKIQKIFFSQEFALEERDEENSVSRFCQSKQISIVKTNQSTLIHPSDLPFELGKMPFGFTPFRHKVEPSLVIRPHQDRPKRLPPMGNWFPDFLSEASFAESLHSQIGVGECLNKRQDKMIL